MGKGFIGRSVERLERAIVLVMILNFLIVAHELGHLLVGKAFGFATLSFNVGVGPVFRSYSGSETFYNWRWIPMGGYVEFFQRDKYDPESLRNYIKEIEEVRPNRAAMLKDPTRDLSSASRWQLILMLLAGPVVNILIGRWCLRYSQAVGRREHSKIIDLLDKSPADPRLIEEYMRFVADFSPRRSRNSVNRNSKIRPRFGWLFSLGGPVSVVKQLWGDLEVYHRRPMMAILRTMGSLSIGLGVVNLFPIPPLDGGRILLVIFDGGVSPESTLAILFTFVSALGFVGLILLGDARVLYQWAKDIVKRILRR